MLDLFNDDIFTVYEYKNITRAELNCIHPSLYRRIEGMARSRYNLFTIDEDADQFVRLVNICF